MNTMTPFFQPGAATDPIYCNTRAGATDHHARGRDYIESLWEQGAPYVDADAADKATRDLASVFWELQLVHLVKSAGRNLLPRGSLAYKNNKGPDLCAPGQPDTWIEAVVVRPGTGPDALHYHEPGKVYDYDPDGVVLRLRSVILDKSKKIENYIVAGIIKPGQATVIAISGVILPHRYSGITPPEIVRAVYPANNPVLEINRVKRAVTGSYVRIPRSREEGPWRRSRNRCFSRSGLRAYQRRSL